LIGQDGLALEDDFWLWIIHDTFFLVFYVQDEHGIPVFVLVVLKSDRSDLKSNIFVNFADFAIWLFSQSSKTPEF
jgi:hypothetical protein